MTLPFRVEFSPFRDDCCFLLPAVAVYLAYKDGEWLQGVPVVEIMFGWGHFGVKVDVFKVKR